MHRDIGILHGRILVFGGVYSNLQALEKLQVIAMEKGIGPQNILCTGDIVAYCAQPEECLSLIREWGIHCIAGNVEISLREGALDCGCDFRDGSRCDVFSRQWYPYAQSQVSASSLAWAQQLPIHLSFEIAGKKGLLVHGSPQAVSDYVFASTIATIGKTYFQSSEAELIIAGHCGLPFFHTFEKHLWFNPGVIGMPANDGTPRVWYGILEEREAALDFSIESFEYDHQTANRLMTERHLPPEYARTLLNGLWDNCEILPPIETQQQGRALHPISSRLKLESPI